MARYKAQRLTCSTAIMATILGAALTFAPAAWADGKTVTFDIPSENAAKALNDFSAQANVQLLFPYEVASRSVAPALKGEMTRDAALAQLLANTGLEVASQTETTISLRVKESPGTASTEPATEVIVTGTHIRGGNPTSPVHTVTRKDIEQSGYSQIGDVMRSLPENFSGGQNPGVVAAGANNASNQNISNGSTVNLRGLGSDATLVLLNGHRLVADTYYQGADISGIPLAAVQRIEIVPDGASALYGSDAVAGVANIVLRRNFSGGELSVRGGAATQGAGTERTVSLMQGATLGDGYLVASLEWSRQDPITTGQRDFTSGVGAESTLMQAQDRRSLFIGAGYDLGERVSVTFDGLVSDRQTHSVDQYSADSPANENAVYTPNYNAAITLDVKLAGNWKLRLTGVGAGSRNSQHYNLPAYGIAGAIHYANDLQYGEAVADGTWFHLPAGDLKVALGAGYRQEHFAQPGVIDEKRHVSYAFAEALVPLVLPSSDRKGLQELEISLSGRTENYSDFGTTTNPRIGVRYRPFDTLTVRGTWGTSFKAPSFIQMYDEFSVYLYDATVVGSTAGGTALLTGGGNPDLKPEKSTSETLGFDYSPLSLPTLKLSATWFGIDYKDRVVSPIANYTLGLSDPRYDPFIARMPSAADQAALIASAASFYNFSSSAYDPSAVVAILYNQNTNASAQNLQGVDLGYQQTFDLAEGALNLFANGTLIKLEQQTISTAPVAELSGTIFNVPKFKARAGLTWTRKTLAATAIVNYVASETDTGVTPNVPVGSWTTFDANVSYGFAPQWKAILSASNLFDRAPPYTVSPLAYAGLHFDSTNASVIGRFVSLTLARTW